MNSTEFRAAYSLAGIFSLRMLGLFMIYPVFTIFAQQHLVGATPITIGLALGAYGLAQAVFQIPFGLASDRVGRKKMIAIGLLIFAVGSVVAALSDSIWGVIAGRLLQGGGAVSSVILALNADLTLEENRNKSMAIIGMTIGLAFAIALVLGPLLNGWIGVPGIFGFTAVLALAGVPVLYKVTPEPAAAYSHRDTQAVPAMFWTVLGDPELRRFDFGIFALHAMLAASFIALPELLRGTLDIGERQEWMVYLPVLAVSFVVMIPAVILAEAKRLMKPVFIGSVALLLVTQVVLAAYHNSWLELVVLLTLFFAAFNVMEASLPSLISKAAPADGKGTAMGVYSSAQFFGIFAGGMLGGWAYGADGVSGVFWVGSAIAVVWLGVAATMPQPRFARTHLLAVGALDDDEANALARRIEAEAGVFEASVVSADRVAYIKFDGKLTSADHLDQFAAAQAHAGES
ncbi:MFS transporter [Salinisphaera sp. USBA-960]|uniref:MFS transporter n=1 Tax=Salinisphaera orenii TaxID=856731 RepID=UPI000DBE7DC2|nr:MFS transporter [Salifodinibacter halophilus]NNC27162.1 MFS transporter [Salifodinibacter halophilus]